MKNQRLFPLLSVAFCALSLTSVKAQMVGGDAYIQGFYVEIGVSGEGGFEGINTTTSPVPVGMHFRSGNPIFGFVANPLMDAWTFFDGDYFTPGTPENGWGFEIGTSGAAGANNAAVGFGPPALSGTITAWNHIGTTYSVDWEGTDAATGLHFLINYHLEETDLFYTTTISITNTTGATINDIYYCRNVDPDNNQSISFDFTTQNTIVSQEGSCPGCVAHVTATSAVPATQPVSYCALLAIDTTGWRAGYGGFSNRDASDMYNGWMGFTQTVGATNYADEAIFVAYLIPTLGAGVTDTFKFCTVFDDAAVGCAMASGKVSFAGMPNVCTVDAAFTLTGGSPAGGTYFGTGVSGSTFDPAVAGPGNHIISYTCTDSTGCSTSVLQDINVDVCAGVEEGQSANQVSVYPNPFTESTTITIGKDVLLNNAQFLMYDVLGKEVINMKDIRSKQFNINKNTLDSGVYFFKLINDNKGIGTGKLFIR